MNQTTSQNKRGNTEQFGLFEPESPEILPEPNFTLSTDGGCWPNDGTGKGGWGFVLWHDGKKLTGSGRKKPTTNNEMELTAIFEGLSHTPKGEVVLIRSDSQYAINCCSEWGRKWKAKGWTKKGGEIKNLELIKRIFAMTEERFIQWQWVKGHNGDPDNEECDQLASKAAQSF